MTKLKVPMLSFLARGGLGAMLSFRKGKGSTIAEKKPVPSDVQSLAQLSWRHMFNKCVDLWHELSTAEKAEWESAARSRHMTGYAWYISQCLRPNPGIYLPLQGGTMSGDIDMAKNRLLKLPAPTDAQEAARKAEADAIITAYTKGCRVFHNANQAIPHNTWTTLAFNTERYDTDAMHDTVVNNDRITIKTLGKYVLGVNIQWAGNVAGGRQVMIEINDLWPITYVVQSPDPGGNAIQNACVVYIATVGTFFKVKVYQSSGGALNVQSASNFSPEFFAQRVG